MNPNDCSSSFSLGHQVYYTHPDFVKSCGMQRFEIIELHETSAVIRTLCQPNIGTLTIHVSLQYLVLPKSSAGDKGASQNITTNPNRSPTSFAVGDQVYYTEPDFVKTCGMEIFEVIE